MMITITIVPSSRSTGTRTAMIVVSALQLPSKFISSTIARRVLSLSITMASTRALPTSLTLIPTRRMLSFPVPFVVASSNPPVTRGAPDTHSTTFSFLTARSFSLIRIMTTLPPRGGAPISALASSSPPIPIICAPLPPPTIHRRRCGFRIVRGRSIAMAMLSTATAMVLFVMLSRLAAMMRLVLFVRFALTPLFVMFVVLFISMMILLTILLRLFATIHGPYLQPRPLQQSPLLLDILFSRPFLLMHGKHGILVSQMKILIPFCFEFVFVFHGRRCRGSCCILNSQLRVIVIRVRRLRVSYAEQAPNFILAGSAPDANGGTHRTRLFQRTRHGTGFGEIPREFRFALGNIFFS
mmetsp:Transcript_27705/g.58547  ORF Transcript_27705/g.58547 Transcript_27705/m.58547 type:complete len:354 (+) Transcript_27705:453-1514(+)